jgi:hypothetical protein
MVTALLAAERRLDHDDANLGRHADIDAANQRAGAVFASDSIEASADLQTAGRVLGSIATS